MNITDRQMYKLHHFLKWLVTEGYIPDGKADDDKAQREILTEYRIFCHEYVVEHKVPGADFSDFYTRVVGG